MRFEHDTYDIDVYSLCESVYYSCNNDEYDYVLECVNDWIMNGYNEDILLEDIVLNEVISQRNGHLDFTKASTKEINYFWAQKGLDQNFKNQAYNELQRRIKISNTRKGFRGESPTVREQIRSSDAFKARAQHAERQRDIEAAFNSPEGKIIADQSEKIATLTPGTTIQPKPAEPPPEQNTPPTSPTPKPEPSSTPLEDKKGKPAQTPPTPPNPPVVTNQSRLSRATNWVKNNKVKTAVGVGLGAAAIGGGIYAYKQYKNRPKSVIAKRIAALRSIYKKFMISAQKNPQKANVFKRIAAKILSVIDKLLGYLQNKADGR